jgi:hypothetical protein
MLPNITFTPVESRAHRVGLPPQPLAGADRPMCALSAAAASVARGLPVGGAGRHLTTDQILASLRRSCEMTYGLDWSRVALWARGLGFERLGDYLPADPRAWGGFVPLPGITLDQYQIDALRHMTVAGGVLAMGCGLGKTYTAMAAANVARATGLLSNETRLWIFAPVNAHSVWAKQVPMLQACGWSETVIVSIDQIHKMTALPRTGGVAIFDEVHMLGDTSARRTESAHEVRQAFDFALCLTGTLLHAGIEKSLSILDLAVPGAARFSSRWKCGEFFHVLSEFRLATGRKVSRLEKPAGQIREKFNAWISDFVVSISNKRADIVAMLGLPEQDTVTEQIGTPWPSLTDCAVAEAQRLMAEDPEGKIPTSAAVAHALCAGGLDRKIDWLLEMIDTPDVPLVVTGVYRESLSAVRDALDGYGIRYVFVDGAVTGAKRAKAVEDFQTGKAQVFLCQMDAASVAVDLTRAAVTVALEHSWRAANYDQFLARTRRRGQEAAKCVHVDLVCNPLQLQIVKRIREAQDFDASLSEWQAVKAAIANPA